MRDKTSSTFSNRQAYDNGERVKGTNGAKVKRLGFPKAGAVAWSVRFVESNRTSIEFWTVCLGFSCRRVDGPKGIRRSRDVLVERGGSSRGWSGEKNE